MCGGGLQTHKEKPWTLCPGPSQPCSPLLSPGRCTSRCTCSSWPPPASTTRTAWRGTCNPRPPASASSADQQSLVGYGVIAWTGMIVKEVLGSQKTDSGVLSWMAAADIDQGRESHLQRVWVVLLAHHSTTVLIYIRPCTLVHLPSQNGRALKMTGCSMTNWCSPELQFNCFGMYACPLIVPTRGPALCLITHTATTNHQDLLHTDPRQNAAAGPQQAHSSQQMLQSTACGRACVANS